MAPHKVGDKSFYAGMKETSSPNIQTSADNTTDVFEMDDHTQDNTMDTDTTGDQTNSHSSYDEGEQNLDLMLCVMDEQDKLEQDVLTLGDDSIEDVQDRMGQMDIPYLTGLQKILYSLHGHSKNYRTSSFSYSQTCITTSHLLFSIIFIHDTNSWY